MFRNDPELAEPARIVSSLTRDITELMSEIGLQAHVNPTGQRVAYHSACSLQHGQQIREQPKQLLKEAGFVVLDPPEGHLCCGSAGTYNLLQPEIARRLRDRKVANIGATSPDLIAAGNIGCLTQIASGTKRAGRPHGRTSRLGDGRAAAQGERGRSAESASASLSQARSHASRSSISVSASGARIMASWPVASSR